MRLIRFFIISAGVLLLITGLAKVISVFSSARILEVNDGLIGIPYRYLFLAVGGLEIFVAGYCFFGKHRTRQAVLVTWLSLMFVLYRLGLMWVGYRMPCPCLGTLTSALHIGPHVADVAMQLVLGYLVGGGCVAIVWIWRERAKRQPPASSMNAWSASA